MPIPYGRDRAVDRRDGSWAIVTPSVKGWRARTPATRLTPEHPGTAVSWDGVLFEVVAAESAGGAQRYTLAPWEDRHTIRGIEPYDAASEAERARTRVDASRRDAMRRALLVSAPLAGHAPADVQERWEREYDVSAALLTIVSALPLFVFGFLCSLSLAIRGFTGVVLLPFSERILWFGVFLFVESGFRLAVAWSAGSPAGSLAGSLAWRLLEMGRRGLSDVASGPR